MKFTIESKYEIGDKVKISIGLAKYILGVVVDIELFQYSNIIQIKYLVETKSRERRWFQEQELVFRCDGVENNESEVHNDQ